MKFHRRCLTILLILPIFGTAVGYLFAGPFGFEAGMTKDQITKLVGEKSLTKSDGDAYVFSTASKPHPMFEEYMAIISPAKGLVKLIAVGKDVETSEYGDELKSRFEDIRKAVAEAYGEATTFDHLREGSIWNEPKDWMMGILKKERTLAAYWTGGKYKDNIAAVSVVTNALSQSKGYIDVGYEFEVFKTYQEEKKHKQDKVF